MNGRTKRWFLFSLAGFSACVARAATTTDDAMTDFSPPGLVEFMFSAERLSSLIGDKLQVIGDATLGFAFLCLVVPSVYGIVRRGINPETINCHVLQPLILCGLIATLATTKTIVTTGFDELAHAAGYEGPALLHKYYAETKIFAYTKTPAEIRDELVTDDRGALLTDFVALLTFLKDLFAWSADKIMVVPAAVLLALLSLGAGVGTFLAEFARLACLELGYALLPLFVAGLNSSHFRLAATRALLRLLCVHTWTLTWSLAGAVTIGLVHMLHRYVDDLYGTVGAGPTPPGGFYALLPDLPLSVLVLVIGMMTAATLWHLFALLTGPVVISRLVTGEGAAVERWTANLAHQIAFLPPALGAHPVALLPVGRPPDILLRSVRNEASAIPLPQVNFPGRMGRTLQIGGTLPDAREKVLTRLGKL